MATGSSTARAYIAMVIAGAAPLAPLACGLGAGGTASDPASDDGDGGVEMTTEPPLPPADAGPESGKCTACVAKHDAATASDAASAKASDAASDADGAPSVCGDCVTNACPGQSAACGTGSSCQAYAACDLACSAFGDDDGGCTQQCGASNPTGEDDLAALTLCSLACGAGCAVESVSVRVPAGSTGD